MADNYQKLVRDNIPAIIRQQGHTPRIVSLDDNSYFAALNEKLREEVAEYFEDYDVHELADIVEVVLALAKCQGYDRQEFEAARIAKHAERGGFDDRIFLLDVERSQAE